jgi:hypothetical protein
MLTPGTASLANKNFLNKTYYRQLFSVFIIDWACLSGKYQTD